MSSKRAHNGRNLTGQSFERLTVVSRAESKNFRSRWNCVCSCGAEKTVTLSDLVTGHAKSCGCLNAEVRRTKATTHGRGSRSNRDKTYVAWLNMRRRCYYEKAKGYQNYGGRGIKVCDAWASFELFLQDMGACPDGMSLERREVNGHYEPGNCLWASQETQDNNKRATLWVEVDGIRMSAMQAAKYLSAPYERVRWAIKRHGEKWLEFVIAAAALAPTP